MPRRALTPEFSLPPRQPAITKQRWLYTELKNAIVEGRLRGGAHLPSSRALARNHSVSRSTVKAVYDQLVAEGFVTATRGSGTAVTIGLRLNEDTRSARPDPPREPSSLLQKAARPFRPFTPAYEMFPFAQWARCLGNAARGLTSTQMDLSSPVGLLELREQIANHLYQNRGLSCDPQSIMITSGTQHSLDLLCRAWRSRDSPVFLEDPGHKGARDLFRWHGLKVVPVPVDAQGLRPLPTDSSVTTGSLVFTTPAHQLPTGVVLSAKRRLELLAWAVATDSWIFEDDYDGEFRFVGAPVAPLKTLDRENRVIYAGSFSKLLYPGFRLGYVVLPPVFYDRIVELRQLTDRHVPVIDQLAAASFIREDYLGRHLRRVRQTYRERRQALKLPLISQLQRQMSLDESPAGLQLCVQFSEDRDDKKLADRGRDCDLDLTPLSSFCINRKLSGFLLGYAAYSKERLERAAERLSALLQ